MKKIIATNCKFELTPKADYKHDELVIIDLDYYAADSGVTEIVLMCKNILGAGNIELLEKLTKIINSYPEEIPCYVLGIGSGIPNDNWNDFRHEQRDKTIRLFLDSIFKRAQAIGVRGELTRRWLNEYFGYPAEQIFKFYEENQNNKIYIRNFIDNYYDDCPFTPESINHFNKFNKYNKFTHDIFNSKYCKNIIIEKPYIQVTDDHKCRLHCHIRIDGVLRNLYVEYDCEYQEYIDTETVDAFLTAVLPLALRTNRNIFCKAPVSEELLHNIEEILTPALCLADNRLRKPEIFATTVVRDYEAQGVALCFSCGVDSFYSLHKYYNPPYESYKLTHLFVGNYLYTKSASVINQRVEKVGNEIGLKVIKTNSNITEAFREINHLFWHTYKTFFQIMPLKKLLGKVIYSTGYDYGMFNIDFNATRASAESELLTVTSLSTSEMEFIDCGGGITRLEKVREIINFAPAHKNLNVCLYPGKEINCGNCEKCMRTLLELDMNDSLSLFSGSFHVDEYNNNRKRYLKYLITHKNDKLLREIYDAFLARGDKDFLSLVNN